MATPKNKKFVWIALGVGLIVFIVWLLLRGKKVVPVQQNRPNTDQSGVTSSAIPVSDFTVQPYQPAPSPFALPSQIAGAGNNFFFGANPLVPATGHPIPDGASPAPNITRMTFNYPPANGQVLPPSPGGTGTGVHDAVGSCGCNSCESGCSTYGSRFPDGRGACMASSRRQQISTGMISVMEMARNIISAAPNAGIDWFNTVEQQMLSYRRDQGGLENFTEPAGLVN